VQGVAGDAYGGLWWIETPQTALDQWQLWHYDPATAAITMRLQATGALFTGPDESTRRSPNLVAVQPVIPGDPSNVILYVDTTDVERQTPYAGLYRLSVLTEGEGGAQVSDGPQRLLEDGQYRGPLVVSPDLSRLAYFTYDAAVPSLTAGAEGPPNTLKLLTLPPRGASASSTAYTSETRFEFLAPTAAWVGNDRLLAARSRFAAEGGTTPDNFGLVQVELPAAGAGVDDSVATPSKAATYLLPRQQTLLDFAACRDGTAILLTRDREGNQALARWEGQGQSFPLFGLPAQLDRTLSCWQAQAE
jgi:hypothetical protein